MEHQEKLFEIQGDAEEKSGKNSNGASTSEKSEQASVIKEADENPCDILTAQVGKENYSYAWLLNLGCTYHM